MAKKAKSWPMFWLGSLCVGAVQNYWALVINWPWRQPLP